MSPHILLVDDEPMNITLVSRILTKAGFDVTPAGNAQEAIQEVEKQPFDLLILDVIMPEMDGYALCRHFRKNPKTAQTPIILLTSLESLEHKIKGFEAGADDYLLKPCQAEELVARVNVWLRHASAIKKAPQVEQKGKIIAVHSLRGGVGVSSLAANLAVGLAQLWGIQSVLVDLVLTAGQAALMLNLPHRNTWADIAHIPSDEIDSELVSILLRLHRSGTNVLPAPRRVEEAELIDNEKVVRVLNLLRDDYEYLVLDLPHNFTATTLAGLDMADIIFTVFAPELASVRAMSMALGIYRSLDYPDEKIRLALNWTFERHGLSREDIEKTLNHKIDVVIPYAPAQFIRAINFGTPPVHEDPNSPIGALFEDLAFIASKDEHKKHRPKEPTAAWVRMAKRLQARKSAARK